MAKGPPLCPGVTQYPTPQDEGTLALAGRDSGDRTGGEALWVVAGRREADMLPQLIFSSRERPGEA